MKDLISNPPCSSSKLYSRHAEKYVRRGRLDWPEGGTSKESIRAVQKLPRLQVCVPLAVCMFHVWLFLCLLRYLLIWSFDYLQNLIMQNVDHSAGDLIHLLQGLLKYDPCVRLTAREALRHPFFSKDNLRR